MRGNEGGWETRGGGVDTQQKRNLKLVHIYCIWQLFNCIKFWFMFWLYFRYVLYLPLILEFRITEYESNVIIAFLFYNICSNRKSIKHVTLRQRKNSQAHTHRKYRQSNRHKNVPHSLSFVVPYCWCLFFFCLVKDKKVVCCVWCVLLKRSKTFLSITFTISFFSSTVLRKFVWNIGSMDLC